MAEWRSILCRDVDWYLCGVSLRASHVVRFQCRDGEPWANITLGELADMGVRAWRHSAGTGFGEKSAEVIKATIDMAAEGVEVAPKRARDAYIPKCERVER